MVARMMSRLILLVVLLFPGSPWAAGVILVLGDSISSGYGLPREAGWVQLLANRVARDHSHYRVVNASITGETTLGGRNRIGKLLDQHAPALVVVELGGNDGLRGTPIESMQANLEAIVRACKERGAKVLLVGMRLPPNYGAAFNRRFEEAYRNVAAGSGAALQPFLFEGFGERRDLFQADGIHPTQAAQALMLETVWKSLGPMLGPKR